MSPKSSENVGPAHEAIDPIMSPIERVKDLGASVGRLVITGITGLLTYLVEAYDENRDAIHAERMFPPKHDEPKQGE